VASHGVWNFERLERSARGFFKGVWGPAASNTGLKGAAIMTKYALYVPLEAKPGKEKEVADFLRSAVPLVNAEMGTISWFAIQEGPSSFAIFDTFDDEAGRDAHLNGKVAAALMEKASSLLAKPPQIHKLGILADKLPG
jgi:quinol monooxygenase YgiN